jgi:hypothetical protein
MNMEVSSQPQEIHNGGYLRNTLSKLIEECNSEPDIDKKIQLFYKVNSILPEKDKVIIQSLITDDYIDTVLYRIYQNL